MNESLSVFQRFFRGRLFWCFFSFFYSCFVFSPSSLWATEMISAWSGGLGATGRASIQTVDTPYLNPARVGFLSQTQLGASYQAGWIQKGVYRTTYNAHFIDAEESLIAPGFLGYRQHQTSAPGDSYKGKEIRVGLGLALLSQLSLGLSYKYINSQNTGSSKPQNQNKQHNQHNLDIGLLGLLSSQWTLSLTGENLIQTPSSTPEPLKRPSRLGLGTQFIWPGIFIARYEVFQPLYHKPSSVLLDHGLGLGFFMPYYFFLNTGYSLNSTQQQSWLCLGLTWMGPRLKWSYSFQKENRSGLDARHLIDFWLDF